MAVETERKFLVGALPELPRFPWPQQLHQMYIVRADGLEVRLRQAGQGRWLTIKTGNGLERDELEIPLSAKQYRTLRNSDSNLHISKLRYRLPLDNCTAELDLYGGELAGLKTVEVEFPDTNAAASFIPPLWFGPEVTGVREFANVNLAGLDHQTARQTLGPLLDPPQVSYGAIPVIMAKGQTQVVIITTKSLSRWIFPKGTPEDNKSPQAIALEEAVEEAGIEGQLVGLPLSLGYWRDWQFNQIQYWPMLVSTIHDRWDEDSVRQRIICTPEEACVYLDDPHFIHALQKALKQVAAS